MPLFKTFSENEGTRKITRKLYVTQYPTSEVILKNNMFALEAPRPYSLDTHSMQFYQKLSNLPEVLRRIYYGDSHFRGHRRLDYLFF